MIEQAEYVTISELVRLSGTRCSTLKYHNEEGLLSFEQNEMRLTRRYHRTTTLQWLEQFQQLKMDEFSI